MTPTPVHTCRPTGDSGSCIHSQRNVRAKGSWVLGWLEGPSFPDLSGTARPLPPPLSPYPTDRSCPAQA